MHRLLLDDTINNAVNKINSDDTKPLDMLIAEKSNGLDSKIGESDDTGNTTVFGKLSSVSSIYSNTQMLFEGLMIPKFTKAIIASGSFTIPKDGTYKIIACGAGGITGRGGGGCAIDQRDYVAGDILTLTVSGVASAICSARSLSMTANGTTTATGATASGGNVANHTGGTCASSQTTCNSDGCGAGGYSYTYGAGGIGGIIGGDGFNVSDYHDAGDGGAGGIIGGSGGSMLSVAGSYYIGIGGVGGVFGGHGGSRSGSGDNSSMSSWYAGKGGNGGYVGGDGGKGCNNTATYPGGNGGNGGSGGLLGGNGGDGGSSASGIGGNGGKGGSGHVVGGLSGSGSSSRFGGAGGAGGNAGMLWAVPFKEVKTENWTKGNAIIFIEEV